MVIDPRALRRLREEKHWTQDALAEASGVSQRQIARIESSRVSTPRAITMRRLADALQVEVHEMGAADHARDAESGGHRYRPSETKVPEDMYFFYDLLWLRYGIGMREVVRLAPLMFTLLAELSFEWRKALLHEVDIHLRRVGTIGAEEGHTYFGALQAQWSDRVAEEEELVAKRDLLSSAWGQDGNSNPFRDYLLHLCGQVGKPEVVRMEDFAGEGHTITRFKLCEAEWERITGGISEAAQAIATGRLRITEIPAELMAEDALEERVAWLKSKTAKESG